MTFELGKITELDPYVVVLLYDQVPVAESQRFVGVDSARSNERTAPSWELADADSENSIKIIELKDILSYGSLFTKKDKLKANIEKNLAKFLSQRRKVEERRRAARGDADD